MATECFSVNAVPEDMYLAAVRDHVDDQCEFPITHEELVTAVGSDEVKAPTTDGETIATILGRTSEDRYRSADGVYTSVVGCVSAEFIGPKNYDDRAGARSVPEDRDPRTA